LVNNALKILKDTTIKRHDENTKEVIRILRQKMRERMCGHVEIHLNAGEVSKLKCVEHINLK
jgi:hypothetical protein